MAKERQETHPEVTETVRKEAEKRLAWLGLSLKSIRGKSTLDVGASDRVIEKVARFEGAEDYISLDRTQNPLYREPYLKGTIVARANAIPLPDNNRELVLAWSGVPLHTKEKDEAEKILLEMERVISETGEIRINPPRLAFIERELIAKDPELEAVLGKGFRRTMKDAEILKKYRDEVTRRSTEFLLSAGFDVHLESLEGDERVDDFHKNLWIIKKRKNVN